MKTYLPVLKLQMGTMRQSLGCPGVLDLVGTSIMPIFRYLFFFAPYLIGAPANLHMKTIIDVLITIHHPRLLVMGQISFAETAELPFVGL
jgi:hypothetical protein